MKQTFTDQNPSQLPASKEVAGGPITPRVDHRPLAIDTLTGTALIGCLRREYAGGFTLAGAEELGCLDAPGKLPAGSVLSYNGRLLPSMEWR